MPPRVITGMRDAANAVRDRMATASARATTQQAIAEDRLARATLNAIRQSERANELAKDRVRLAREGNHEEAARAGQAYERQIRRENDALAERNNILEEQRGATQNLMRSMSQRGAQQLSTGISNIVTATIQRMRGQIEYAHHALLSNTRDFSQITRTSLVQATLQYEAALGEAIKTGIKYGQSVDEITRSQQTLVELMAVDVSRSGWFAGIAAITDDMANMASRAGRSVDEVSRAGIAMEHTFGRGTVAQMTAFTAEMNRASMVPEVLRARMEAAGEETGMLFNNRESQLMIEHWTEQFGDQASNLSEMSANMWLFGKRAAAAGHQLRTVTAIQNAMVQGTVGRRGDDVITVRAGQRLRAQLEEAQAQAAQGDHTGEERLLQHASPEDREIIQGLMASRGGLVDSDIFHMLQNTTVGIQAAMDSVVGIREAPDDAIAGRLLKEEGFDAGDDQEQIRLAHLYREQLASGANNMTEIEGILSAADTRAAEQQRARDIQYTNVAAAAFAAETAADLLAQVVANTGVGGAVVAGLAGVGALMARAFPSIGDEWRDLFEGRVDVSNNPTTVLTQGQLNEARSAGDTKRGARQQLQDWFDDTDFDASSTAGQQQIRALLARARRELNDDQFDSVMDKVTDVGFTGNPGTLRSQAVEDAAYQRAHPSSSARSGLPTLSNLAPPPTPTQHRAVLPPPPPDRAATAGTLISESETPASTPISTPAPIVSSAPQTSSAPTQNMSMTAEPARGRLNPDGSVNMTLDVRMQNFTPLVDQASAQIQSTQSTGVQF